MDTAVPKPVCPTASAGDILWYHSPKPAWMNLYGNLLLPKGNLGPGWAQHGAGYELSTVGEVQGTNWGVSWGI